MLARKYGTISLWKGFIYLDHGIYSGPGLASPETRFDLPALGAHSAACQMLLHKGDVYGTELSETERRAA